MVDLSLSAEEIQELMLTQLLPSVYKQQLIQHLHLQNDKQLLQDKLVSEVVRGPAVFYNRMKKINVWLSLLSSHVYVFALYSCTACILALQ